MTSLIGIGFLKMTHQVYTVVDFLGPLGGFEARLAQRKPKAIKPYWASRKSNESNLSGIKTMTQSFLFAFRI